jgi:hypothetical protein
MRNNIAIAQNISFVFCSMAVAIVRLDWSQVNETYMAIHIGYDTMW